MGDTPDHLGHRARLRSRLLDDAEGLADYELIQYLIALAIPRRDTKPLDKALLREFGSLAQLVNAAPASRSAERRVGKECVRTCKSRWSQSHYKTNNILIYTSYQSQYNSTLY